MGPAKRGSHLLDIGDVWVVFGRHEQQVQPLIELDPVQGGDAHVQENPEEHRQGDLAQQVPDDHGEAWGGGGQLAPGRPIPTGPEAPLGWAGEVHIPTSRATSSPVTRCSFTSWILGLSPGATALLMTVSALA